MNINISKRNLIVIIATVLLCISVYALLFTFSLKQEFRELENRVVEKLEAITVENVDTSAPLSTEEKDAESYTLYEHNGKIGIYDSETLDLLKILEVYVITLPDADQAMLSEGIRASSRMELVSLVQDYTS